MWCVCVCVCVLSMPHWCYSKTTHLSAKHWEREVTNSAGHSHPGIHNLVMKESKNIFWFSYLFMFFLLWNTKWERCSFPYSDSDGWAIFETIIYSARVPRTMLMMLKWCISCLRPGHHPLSLYRKEQCYYPPKFLLLSSMEVKVWVCDNMTIVV